MYRSNIEMKKEIQHYKKEEYDAVENKGNSYKRRNWLLLYQIKLRGS
jgi:hypothetical protein